MKLTAVSCVLAVLAAAGTARGALPGDEAAASVAQLQEVRESAEAVTRAERRLKRVAKICTDIANADHASKLSQCTNDVFFAGHLTPDESTHGDSSAASTCATMNGDETNCRQTFGCLYKNRLCIDVTNNDFCDKFTSRNACQGSSNNRNNANACYWSGGECLLRFQDCSQLSAVDCVEVDGCMWFNDLVRGHQAFNNNPPGTSSVSRGRCMADPCFRINNGRCTIQHTGGRCVWYTKEQNRQVRGYNFPGCYTSPCNNRFKRRDCRGDDVYKCTWCGQVRGLKLGCQNKEATSKAQCWNVKANDRGTPAPERANSKCTSCLQSEAFEDGRCHFRSSSTRSRCEKYCCQSPYCHCMFKEGDFDAQAGGSSGLDLSSGDDS